LTVGSVVGAIRDLFIKIKAIDAKHGKFDLVLCTGDFFGPLAASAEVNDEDETKQLLDGKLEGAPDIFKKYVCCDLDACSSPHRMLYHARRISFTRSCCSKVFNHRG
jgi:hypothetical protein